MIGHAVRRISFEQLALGLTAAAIALLNFINTAPVLRDGFSAIAGFAASRLASATGPETESARGTPRPGTAESDTDALSAALDYRLEAVRAHGGVPRLLLASLPDGLSAHSAPDQRKALFIRAVLPLILHVNERIAGDRARLAVLRDRAARGEGLAQADVAWLEQKAREYGMARGDGADLDELLRRVDVIPPALALAQAAEESGWGTSRFAREGNALFGQKTWREGTGLTTRDADGRIERYAAFARLIDGVASYARNLNTHPAYEKFRSTRMAQRNRAGSLDGFALAGTLMRYSERGPAYVRTIRTIIRSNGLDAFDRAWLDGRPVLVAAVADAG